MSRLSDDLRFAVRTLAKAPAFASAAVITLALGIGANAAIFSVIDAVLLRPLPVREPERVVRIYETMTVHGAPGGRGSVSWPNFEDWRREGRAFAKLAAYSGGSASIRDAGDAERVDAVAGTGELFAVLGAGAQLGRGLQPADDAPGAGRVVVLSDALWKRRYGGDPAVVGRRLVVDGRPHTVVGVMPASFRFPLGSGAALWTALDPGENRTERGNHWMAVIGRLAPGATLAQASAQLRGTAARLARDFPEEQTGRSVELLPVREVLVGRVRPALLVLLGAVGLVLLIACANVANLTLARATVRRREVAVRLALGASPWRLVRQLLTESLVLAAIAAAVGGVVARVAFGGLAALAEHALPLGAGLRFDASLLGYLLLVTVLTTVAFGLVPALRAVRPELRESIADSGARGGTGAGTHRARGALVVAQVALSMVLLVGATLLLRGFFALRATDSGLDATDVLTAHVPVPATDSGQAGATSRFLRPVLERVRAIPGVRSAGMISMLPVQEAWTNGSYAVEGKPEPVRGQEPMAERRIASPGYFAALGIALKAGRGFTEDDGLRDGSMPILVNEAFVRQAFAPGESPIGRRVRRLADSAATIVGVVGDVRQAGLDRAPLAEIYAPYGAIDAQGGPDKMVLVVKGSVPATRLVRQVRAAVEAVDAAQPVFEVNTMEEVIGASLADRRLYLWLLGVFGGVALTLAAAGIYGVIAYVVAQRRREMGVRLALGARARDVVALVVRQGATLAAAGIALGLLGAFGLTRLIASMLYGVQATDPLTFAVVPVVLGGVALLAAWLPARRAARVDPVVVLRTE